jgi:tripartite ATP-independent transporter DctP family solute receptor
MKTSRSRFLAGAALSATSAVYLRYPADAAEFTYKVAIDVPADHPVSAHTRKIAQRVADETNGRLSLQVFPDSILGGQNSLVTQARGGAIDFLQSADNIIAEVVPIVAISGVPFAFSDYAQAWNAMDGPLGAYTNNAIVAANIGLTPLGRVWDAGFRQIVNSAQAISAPHDLIGLKMRVPQSSMPVAMFKALGASPTPISASEMYTALQTHLIDGAEMPLVSVETYRLFEVQKFASMTNHVWTAYRFYANSVAWQRLPQELRSVVLRAYNDETRLEREEVARGDAALREKLKSQGMSFNQADGAAFKATLATAGLYRQWRDNFGPAAWALLEKTAGKLA